MVKRRFASGDFLGAALESTRSFVAVVLGLLLLAGGLHAGPRNIIFLIGDGMGPEQVKAAGLYANGVAGTLGFEALPHKGEVTTYAADNAITDSAASGTAMATGVKVNNDVISVATPGDGSELETLLEYYKALGKMTGLVTTTYVTHATPAAFGAHEPSRNNTNEIADDYLNQTRPNVLFGGGGNGLSVPDAQNAGYDVVQDFAGLAALDTESYADETAHVSGQFGTSDLPYEFDGVGSLPHLGEMADAALQILDNDPDGFFLMIEGGRIDHAGHANDLARMVPEIIEFDNTIQTVMSWAAGRDDTLVIVTADHETGGLTVTGNNGAGVFPSVTWSTGGHTAVNVPVYAWGRGAERVAGVLDNTDFFQICVAPSVELLSPPDDATLAATQVEFSVRAHDAQGLSSAELYLGQPADVYSFSGAGEVFDVEIQADNPDTNYEGNATLLINVDGATPHAHGVMMFPTLIGTGGGQVPPGSVIESAVLRVNCFDPGDLLRMYRLIEDWVPDEVTWNNRSSGVPWTNAGADGNGSHAGGAAVDADLGAIGWRSLDVTQFVQAWAGGQPNYGIVFVDSGTNGVDFYSTESSNPPELIVTLASDWQQVDTVTGLSGTEATVTFAPQTLADGASYTWNVLVANAQGEEGWAARDFDLSIDSATSIPILPALVAPLDDAVGVGLSPTLSVTVDDLDSTSLDVVFYGRGATPPDEFEVVALPDTQLYSESFPQTFTAQTQWVVDNAAARGIVFLSHEGDIVQNFDQVEQEWINADFSLSILDGIVPYGLGVGNHDIPTTLFNAYFPYTRYEANAWYGGHYPANSNDNSYQLISAGGEDWLFLHVIYNPAADVLAWADGVLETYPHRKAVITTHSYMFTNGSRTAPGTNVWNELVVPNDNVHVVLCGHESGEAMRTDYVGDRAVHQILADYQGRQNGGDGWLRTLRFVPPNGQIFVETYSPTRNGGAGEYETDLSSQFSVAVPANDFAVIGTVTVDVSAGSAPASIAWPGLSTFTDHAWYVKVIDPDGNEQVSPVWRFTTASDDTTPPVLSSISAVNITDHGATITWTTDEPADSLVEYGLDTSYGSQSSDSALVTSHAIDLTGLLAGATYHYKVTSADSSANPASSGDLTFTTLAEVTPSAPTNLVATAGDGLVSLDWDDNQESDLAGYDVYRSTDSGGPYSLLSSTDAFTSAYADTAVTNETTYYYVVTAVDLASQESAPSNEASATPTDMMPPAAPSSLTATPGDGQISLDWADNTELDLAGYKVYRSTDPGGPHSLLASTDSFTSAYNDTGLMNGVTYYYVVTALDGNLNESLPSDEASATPVDQTPPAAPANLSAVAGDGVVDLTWDGNTEPDIQGYNVYRGTSTGSHPDKINGSIVTVQAFSDTTAQNGTTYFYVVRAVDTSSNPSPDSNEVSATPSDATPPPAPTGLTAQAGNSQVTLDWNDSGAADFASYTVYRSTTAGTGYAPIARGLTASDHTDTGLLNGVTYFYIVTATDTSANESASSSEASATPQAIAYASGEPIFTLGIIESGLHTDTFDDDGVAQVWFEDAGTRGTKGIDGYYSFQTGLAAGDITILDLSLNAWFDDSGDGTVDASTVWAWNFGSSGWESLGITVTATTDGTTYAAALVPASHVSATEEVRIRFLDGIRQGGEAKDRLFIDRIALDVGGASDPPPAAPTGLVAIPGDAVIDLDWDDNSDPDLDGYNVYRSTTSGGGYAQVNAALVGSSAYIDSTVTNGTTYYYVVRAVDILGGESSNSNEATATPTDATAPSAPTGLVATAGDSIVDLAWDANGEGDLDGYNVYRSTTSGGPYGLLNNSGLVTASAYVDATATNGTTYYYVITAVDTSSNESGDSLEASATPQNGPPLPPANLVATAGDAQVTLDWDNNGEPDIAGYNVYRSTTSGGGYSQINGALLIDSDYVDASVVNDTTYFYVVTAVDMELLESGFSSEASATPTDMTPPAAPTGLGAVAADGEVTLDWSDNGEPDLAGYNVYRSTTSGGGYSQINGSLVLDSDYLDTTVVNGTTYFYVVTAVDQSLNESGNTGEASATPGAGPTLHVGDITMGITQKGRNYEAQATVLVLDDSLVPVSAATITGDWFHNGSPIETGDSGSTTSSGTVLMRSPKIQANTGDTFTFVVTGVSLAGYTYDSASNTESEDSVSVP